MPDERRGCHGDRLDLGDPLFDHRVARHGGETAPRASRAGDVERRGRIVERDWDVILERRAYRLRQAAPIPKRKLEKPEKRRVRRQRAQDAIPAAALHELA
jgi:hypothetical protein